MEPRTFDRGNLKPLRIAVLAVSIAGCATAGGSGGATYEDPLTAKAHILRVAIDPTGHADPDPIPVKRKAEIVVWVAPMDSVLTISFPTENPFPQPVICPGGRFCASLLPPRAEAELKDYKYEVKVVTSAGTVILDPKLKVVN